MADKIESVMDDNREIRYIMVGNGTTSDLYSVGPRHGITKIVCYKESGEMSHVPWFAMYQDDKIVRRVNGKWVIEVWYA
jgi:hypothetical protein